MVSLPLRSVMDPERHLIVTVTSRTGTSRLYEPPPPAILGEGSPEELKVHVAECVRGWPARAPTRNYDNLPRPVVSGSDPAGERMYGAKPEPEPSPTNDSGAGWTDWRRLSSAHSGTR